MIADENPAAAGHDTESAATAAATDVAAAPPPGERAVDARPLALGDLPAPRVHTRSRTRLLVWLIPLLALVATGIYLRKWAGDRGPTIVVRVPDATMIQPGETPLRSRGVEIGMVKHVALAGDASAADVTIQLRHDADAFAKDGAAFWLVKPDLSGGSISGLGTVLSGPYLESRGGSGAARTNFVAVPEAPPAQEGGLVIRLMPNLRKTDRGTPILYRGVTVGIVESAMLVEDATHVAIRCRIEPRYGPLVRVDSQFWADAPAEVKGGIFSGVELKVGTLRQLLSGSISFASPDDPLGAPAATDATFVLADEAEKPWKAWSPRIAIDPAQPRPAEPNADHKRVQMPLR